MSLLDRLRAFGNKLGILHIDAPHDVYVPIKITTRTVSLAELEFEVVAVPTIDNNAALNESFATMCAALGVTSPAHGWTIDRLVQELKLSQNGAPDRATIQLGLLERLNADGVPIEDVVSDAVARDQALDVYAVAVRERFIQRARDRTLRQQLLQQETIRLAAESQFLESEYLADTKLWQTWWMRKLENEQTMAEALGYLLEKPIVSIDTQIPAIDATAHTTGKEPMI